MSQLSDGRSTFNTFALLWCENCGKAAEPPRRPSRLPDFVAVADDHLICADCGEMLALLQCVVRGEHYQERIGMRHQWVATLGSLPDRHGSWT